MQGLTAHPRGSSYVATAENSMHWDNGTIVSFRGACWRIQSSDAGWSRCPLSAVTSSNGLQKQPIRFERTTANARILSIETMPGAHIHRTAHIHERAQSTSGCASQGKSTNPGHSRSTLQIHVRIPIARKASPSSAQQKTSAREDPRCKKQTNTTILGSGRRASRHPAVKAASYCAAAFLGRLWSQGLIPVRWMSGVVGSRRCPGRQVQLRPLEASAHR